MPSKYSLIDLLSIPAGAGAVLILILLVRKYRSGGLKVYMAIFACLTVAYAWDVLEELFAFHCDIVRVIALSSMGGLLPRAISRLIGSDGTKTDTGMAIIAVLLPILYTGLRLWGGPASYGSMFPYLLLFFVLFSGVYSLIRLLRRPGKTVLERQISGCAAVLFALILLDEAIQEPFYILFFSLDSLAYLFLSFSTIIIAFRYLSEAGDSVKESMQNIFIRCRLTMREKEIAQLIAAGLRYKEIADRMNISVETVKTHVSRIYKKTGTGNKRELAALLSSATDFSPPREDDIP